MSQAKSTIPPRLLRNFIIDPLSQIRMGLRLISIMLAFMVAMVFVISSGFFAQYTLLLESFNQPERAADATPIVMHVLMRHTIGLGVMFLLFICVLLAAVIFYTHRIYGAQVAIRRFIDDLREGRYQKRCKLRKKDELQELATDLNGLAKILESKYGVKG